MFRRRLAALCSGLLVLILACPTAAQEQDRVATSLAFRPIMTHVPFAVAFNPTGEVLAVGTGDGRLILWDHGDDQRRSVQAHERWTFAIAWTRDGSRIITGGGDALIHVRDTTTLDVVRTLRGHSDDVHAIAISPDDKTLYSAGDDMTLAAWDLQTGDVIYTVKAHQEQIPALALSPDGRFIATGSRDDTVRLWRAADGLLLHTFEGHFNDVLDLDFSADGSLLASASYDTTVMLWGVQERTRRAVLRNHRDRAFAVGFRPGTKHLYSGGEDKRLVVSGVDGERIESVGPLSGDVARLTFTRDGSLWAIASSASYVQVYDWSPGKGSSAARELRLEPPPAAQGAGASH